MEQWKKSGKQHMKGMQYQNKHLIKLSVRLQLEQPQHLDVLLLSTHLWPQTANVQRLQCESVRTVRAGVMTQKLLLRSCGMHSGCACKCFVMALSLVATRLSGDFLYSLSGICCFILSENRWHVSPTYYLVFYLHNLRTGCCFLLCELISAAQRK